MVQFRIVPKVPQNKYPLHIDLFVNEILFIYLLSTSLRTIVSRRYVHTRLQIDNCKVGIADFAERIIVKRGMQI